ncbi:hypothetical protein [Streptomyces chartreusis]|uniref:hypothetical protein n=1 Tax=Streptomyces chartreusis TaxID=1969 RepID=UPI0036814DDC
MTSAPDSYDANVSHAGLLGIRDGIHATIRTGESVPAYARSFVEHFTAIDRTAREGGRARQVQPCPADEQ